MSQVIEFFIRFGLLSYLLLISVSGLNELGIFSDKVKHHFSKEFEARLCSERRAARRNLVAAKVYFRNSRPVPDVVDCSQLIVGEFETKLHWEYNPAHPRVWPNWNVEFVR